MNNYEIDGVQFRLKSPFDFSFLRRYGTVFKVFDDQDSGNICFGVKATDGSRYFVKFAGAPTAEYTGTIESAVERLKAAAPVYQDLAHPTLIEFVKAEEVGGGFAMVFKWVSAVCAHRMYPSDYEKFQQTPLEKRLKIFGDILNFHSHVAEKGYVAIDFYLGSVMWDFTNERTIICDIDFYTKNKAYGNAALWGHMPTQSPEERTDGVLVDEISNVYGMGAMAFALFTDTDKTFEKWPLNEKLYEIVSQATNEERNLRQQSIKEMTEEWKRSNI